MDGWYYKLFGNEFGPIKLDELVALAKSHTISSDDEVRFGDNGQWRRAGSIGQLMAHFPYEMGQRVVPETATSPGMVRQTVFDEAEADSTSTSPNVVAGAGTTVSNAPEIENRWWCMILGQEYGPVDQPQLIEWALSGHLSRDDEVRFGANGQWRRAGSLGQLMANFPFEPVKRVISKTAISSGSDSQPDSPAIPVSATPIVSSASAHNDDPGTATPESGNLWWCIIQGKEYGPVELPKLIEWVATGRLHRDDHVRLGQGAYLIAGELPGLFPELPVATSSETKPEITTRSETRSISIPASKPTEASSDAKSATAPTKGATQNESSSTKEQTTPETKPPAPAAPMSAGFGAASSSSSRPVVPMRRPPPKKSSAGIVEILTGPIGLGIGGAILLGALITLVVMFVPFGDSGAGSLRELQSAMDDVTKLRTQTTVTESDAKPVAEKLGKAGKKVSANLKDTKDVKAKKVLALAKAMVKLSTQDLTKADVEKDAFSSLKSAKKALGVK